MATVSIGLPVYNGAKYVGEAIETILAQDFQDWELIISDNGSTDDTPYICGEFTDRDDRIKFYPMQSNIGLFANFARVLSMANAPFFCWISHDDLRMPELLSKCLETFGDDESIAMVYPTTEMRGKKGQGVYPDRFQVDQESPVMRFRQIIWNLGACNMLHGVFRTDGLRRSRSMRKHLYRAFDNLILAETALRGKIIQIEDVLFIRRMTRDLDLSFEKRNADLINTYDTVKMLEGLTMPHVRLTYAHFELVNEFDLSLTQKVFLIDEIKKCFEARFGHKMRYEIGRALKLIDEGVFYQTWDGDTCNMGGSLRGFHVNTLIKTLQEASFIFPEINQIRQAQAVCLEVLR